MRVHFGTYPAEFYYSNSRLHKCRTRNYVSTLAENGPAMAGQAGPVPAPMKYVCCTKVVMLLLHTDKSANNKSQDVLRSQL